MKTIRIILAEDNRLALKSILEKLERYRDIEIVAVAKNGVEACRLMAAEKADLILMDIEMPIMDGIEATRKIRETNADCKIMMLTTFDDDDKIFNSILVGAIGYLLKNESAEMIYNAIVTSINGGAAMSPIIALKTLQFIKAEGQPQKVHNTECILSAREIEILIGLKDGLGYKQIGYKLDISEGTVRKHIEHIYRKLQVNNKVSAVNSAVMNNWLTP